MLFLSPFSLKATTYHSDIALRHIISMGHRAVGAGFEYAWVSVAPFPLRVCPHGSVTLVQVPQLHIFLLDGLGWLLASSKLRIPRDASLE